MSEYSGYSWIKVPRYNMDEALSWEERYAQLDEHHIQETTFLIDEVRKLATQLESAKRRAANLRKQVDAAQSHQARQLRWDQDYVPYQEDDRDGG